MAHSFRDGSPTRTCTQAFTGEHGYRNFKTFLREDFKKRCGYTDCPDNWFGGRRSFHIDHFKPKSSPEFEHLINEYSNLVYACPHVNEAKSNKWNDSYLDPVDFDFNEHFLRDDSGNIQPKTANAEIMFKDFKLYLVRYAIIWKLEQIEDRLTKLSKLDLSKLEHGEKIAKIQQKLWALFEEYKAYLN